MNKLAALSILKVLSHNKVRGFYRVYFDRQEKFSKQQCNDLKLLLCDYAARVLYIFEKKYPGDKTARICLETTRKYMDGECNQEELTRAISNTTSSASYKAFYDVYASYDVYAAGAAIHAASDAALTVSNKSSVTRKVRAAYASISNSSIAASSDPVFKKEWQRIQLIELIESWETST